MTTRKAKPGTKPKAAPKAASKSPVVKPEVAEPTSPPTKALAASQLLRKTDVIDKMVSEAGMRKGDARRVLDMVLSSMAQGLEAGQDLQLPPLGKVKIAREKDTPEGKMLVLRVKLKTPR